MADYLNPELFLIEANKIPCQFKNDVPDMGHILGGSEKHLKEGTTVELPYWLAGTLSHRDYVDLALPKAYTSRVRNALVADPNSVNLRNLGGGGAAFYACGIKLNNLTEDASLLPTLHDSFRTRMVEIMDQSQHSLGTSMADGHAYEYCLTLDAWERELFAVGEGTAKETREWSQASKKKQSPHIYKMPGTAPDLTNPPVSGSPQVSAKPVESPPEGAAKALAARRESASSSSPTASSSAKTAQLKEFVQDGRHFSLVRNFRVADIVTIMNGFCGAMSLFSSARYLISNDQKYMWLALTYPLAGMIFDALDGKVARWRNESSMLGQELDSLADSISFGVAPAFCAFCLGLRTEADTVVLTGFICCGIARLARFNATVALVPKDATGKSKYFEGLPIPSSLILVGLMAICLKTGHYLGGKGGVPFGVVDHLSQYGIELHWVSLVFVGWATLMVSKTLHIPKF